MMDDKELNRLGEMAPASSEDAKSRALMAARTAFAEAQAEKNVSAEKDFSKNYSKNLQGNSLWARLTHSFKEKLWRDDMNKILLGGTALTSMVAITGIVLVMQNGTKPSQIYIPSETVELGDNAEVEVDIIASADEADASAVVEAPVQGSQVAAPAPPMPEPMPELMAAPAQSEKSTLDGATADVEMNALVDMSTARVREDSSMVVTPQVSFDGDDIEAVDSNPLKSVATDPVSTFSIDVDTANYAYVRQMLNAGYLPNPDEVRVEELINYFDYDYQAPEEGAAPFEPNVQITPTPWNPDTKLLHIGIQGEEILLDEKPKSNLVFLIDVSGSMHEENKLPLLQKSFGLLLNSLEPDDTVSIVVYAGAAGTVLEPTKVSERSTILAALNNLEAGGSTAGAAGIEAAYELAAENFDPEGVNRVMLATDGDFNVGLDDPMALEDFIADKRESGIFLSVIGFGQGNYGDHIMQSLAQNGNGVAVYIDSLSEAQKVLVEEAGSTLYPIAKDVKIQVEFNPAMVAEYRLIGYETRALNREDFNDDKVDAGDIGSGHQVTAIYEITPVGSDAQLIDDLRYGEDEGAADASGGEYAFLKMRYKLPDEDVSQLIELPIDESVELADFLEASDDVRFSVAVAAYGQKLRDLNNLSDFSYDAVLEIAEDARGDDPYGYRSEFLGLVRLARDLSAE